MKPESRALPGCVVRIKLIDEGSFGWEIVREADSMLLDRSPQPFATRLEAIFDSVRATAILTSADDAASSVDGVG